MLQTRKKQYRLNLSTAELMQEHAITHDILLILQVIIQNTQIRVFFDFRHKHPSFDIVYASKAIRHFV